MFSNESIWYSWLNIKKHHAQKIRDIRNLSDFHRAQTTNHWCLNGVLNYSNKLTKRLGFLVSNCFYFALANCCYHVSYICKMCLYHIFDILWIQHFNNWTEVKIIDTSTTFKVFGQAIKGYLIVQLFTCKLELWRELRLFLDIIEAKSEIC